jgi:3-hydroxybutyryl-CoA dehydrogenase
MREGNIGLKTARGFLNYDGLDIEFYRRQRLEALVGILRFLGHTRPPVLSD